MKRRDVATVRFARARVARDRRGLAIIVVVLLIFIVNLIILGLVHSGARDQTLTVHGTSTLRAFYAAEAGVNMAIRELVENSDEDGDGTIGTISDDANSANDPTLGGARLTVARSIAGSQTTVVSTGREGAARRVAEAMVSSSGGGGGATSAMIAYGQSGQFQPRYRLWNGAGWGSEASANSLGTVPYWIVLRGSPLSDQFAMAVLDNDNDIEVQIWDGSAWGVVFQATNECADKTTRIFDLAYEQLSGDLLLVYRESGTSSVRFRIWNGASWSGESSYGMTSGSIKWLRLVPRPGTDDIIIIARSEDSSDHSRAAIWNGTGFSNQVTLTSVSDVDNDRDHSDMVWESTSGTGLAAFGDDDSTPRYVTLSGGSWSGSSSAPSVGSTVQWLQLAADSASDEVILGTQDSGRDINVVIWDGATWGSVLEIETNTADVTRRGFDIAYEQGGGEALVAYDDTSSTLKYRTWDGASWSGEMSGPSGGNSPIWTVQTVPAIDAGHIFVTWCIDNPEIRTAVWDGSSFGATLVLGSTSAPKEYETFMAATSGGAGSGTLAVTFWSERAP